MRAPCSLLVRMPRPHARRRRAGLTREVWGLEAVTSTRVIIYGGVGCAGYSNVTGLCDTLTPPLDELWELDLRKVFTTPEFGPALLLPFSDPQMISDTNGKCC